MIAKMVVQDDGGKIKLWLTSSGRSLVHVALERDFLLEDDLDIAHGKSSTVELSSNVVLGLLDALEDVAMAARAQVPA